MLQLLVNNYIKKSTGTKAKGYHYEVVSMEEYETLKNSIGKVLDEVLNKIKEQKKNLPKEKEVNSLSVVQQQNEPLKANKIKAKNKKFKSSSEEVSDQIILKQNEEAAN
jgi:hypothetical protein